MSTEAETSPAVDDALIERFTLKRVGASPATFDYAKLDWMNGVYLRELSLEDYTQIKHVMAKIVR